MIGREIKIHIFLKKSATSLLKCVDYTIRHNFKYNWKCGSHNRRQNAVPEILHLYFLRA